MKDYEFWVYIVASSSGTLHIGMTNDIECRICQHKSGEFEGFASKYGCNRLVYYEKYDQVLKAISREKQLKGWRREKKIALIERMNPRWEDLADSWGRQMLFRRRRLDRSDAGRPFGTSSSGVLRLGRAPSLRMTEANF